jgi:hypothetical protein
MKIWGSGDIAQPFLTAALDGCPCCLTPRERAPSAHWIGGWVGSRIGLDAVEERKSDTFDKIVFQKIVLFSWHNMESSCWGWGAVIYVLRKIIQSLNIALTAELFHLLLLLLWTTWVGIVKVKLFLRVCIPSLEHPCMLHYFFRACSM